MERTELRSAAFLVLLNLHNLLYLLTLPRAAYPYAAERDLGLPPAAERQPASRGAAREIEQPSGAAHAEHQPHPACSRAQQRHGQRVIIAGQAGPSNVEAMRLDAKLKTWKVFERAIPRAPLERRRPSRAQHVVAGARTETPHDEREQHGAHPAAQMTRVHVRRIVVHGESARGRMRHELGLGERQEGSDQPTARARGDAGEAGRGGAAQQAQDDRLDLVVPVVSGHEVPSPVRSLNVAQPGVPRGARDGLRRRLPELELAELECQVVSRRELPHALSDRPTVRRDSMIRVRDHERETERRRECMEQVEERDGVGTAGHGHDGDARVPEQPGAGNVARETGRQRGHPVV